MRVLNRGRTAHAAAAAAALALPSPGAPALACSAFPAELPFASDSTSEELDAHGAGVLDAFAESYLAARSTSPVRIVGLFDTRGDAAASMTLALARSRRAQMHLATRGLPFPLIRIVLFGEERAASNAAAPTSVRVIEEQPRPRPPVARGEPVPLC